jgi:hypothetical protein
LHGFLIAGSLIDLILFGQLEKLPARNVEDAMERHYAALKHVLVVGLISSDGIMGIKWI